MVYCGKLGMLLSAVLIYGEMCGCSKSIWGAMLVSATREDVSLYLPYTPPRYIMQYLAQYSLLLAHYMQYLAEYSVLLKVDLCT